MALKFPSTRLCASRAAIHRRQCVRPLLQWHRRASALAVPTSTSREEIWQEAKREASLPNADPPLGSQTSNFLQQHSPYVLTTYSKPPPIFEKGEGSYIFDLENRRYLDFTAGIAVASLGHSDPESSRLLAQQSRTLVHVSNLYHSPWPLSLSKLLIEKTLASGAMTTASKVFICNSGTEANEAALKFARKVGSLAGAGAGSGENKKHEIVSFTGSFHGRTMGALSATANPKYQAPFQPLVPGFRVGTFNDLSTLPSLITENTCGVIVEPIQGEGGVYNATPEFLQALRDRCDKVGAALIYDEIQCGMGRTGKLWAHAHFPETAQPDILTTAKALGNGFPIGATLVGENVAGKINVGDHGTTFGGNPLACRVAHYCVERLSEGELLDGVVGKEKVFTEGFEGLRRRFPELVQEIRGRGLMLGLQLSRDPAPIVTAARERGLLVITAGKNTLRFVPPLVISKEEIREGLEILGKAMEAVVREAAGVRGTEGQMEEVPRGR